MLAVFAPRSIGQPALFAALLVLLVARVRVQSQPAARQQRFDDVGVMRRGFRAALLLLGADETMLVAGGQRVESVHVPHAVADCPPHTLFSMASLVLTVKAVGVIYAWLGGPAPAHPFSLVAIPKPLVGAATTYFVLNTALIASAIGALDAAATVQSVERELPVERAELFRRRRRRGARGGDRRPRRLLDGAADWRAGLPDLSHLQGVMGRIQDQQRHVRQVSDLHLATIEALALAIDAKDQTAQSHIRRGAGVPPASPARSA